MRSGMDNFINILWFSLFLVALTRTDANKGAIQFTWKCMNSTCIKEVVRNHSLTEIISFKVCKLLCGPSILWPQPHSYMRANSVEPITSIAIQLPFNTSTELSERMKYLIAGAENTFEERIISEIKGTQCISAKTNTKLDIHLEITDTSQQTLTLSTDESYSIAVKKIGDVMVAVVKGNTFFGIRHGLETLAQLIVYDDVNRTLVMPTYVYIIDKPYYPYRGILLDTSRNYFSVESIKRTINAMAANKLNTFHWHITDSQSFPLKLNNFPQFAEYGAYSKPEVYTEEDVKTIVDYASIHGIRVVPELDGPAHTGEGWQWAPSGTILCLNKEPWKSYCNEPPCGQLNPLSEHTYNILGELFKEFSRLFTSDIIHLGGDEVNFDCWDTSDDILEWIENYQNNEVKINSNWTEKLNKSKEGHFALWSKFHEKEFQKLKEAYKDKVHQPEAVLWTSDLTNPENLDKYFNNTDYIIQVWAPKRSHIIKDLLDRNKRIILSNYDALYFDSGFGGWHGDFSDSIYRPWYSVYDNIPIEIESLPKEKKHLVLGQEAALWTEQVSEGSLDPLLWPRAAALAERTWSNPPQNWRNAESRILYHRDRLIQYGIGAAAIEPKWCHINRGGCSQKFNSK